jgi:hypothetical protein
MRAIDNFCEELQRDAKRYDEGLINDIGFARVLKNAIAALARILFEMVER